MDAQYRELYLNSCWQEQLIMNKSKVLVKWMWINVQLVKNRAGHGGREETRADNKLDSYQFNTHIMES